MVSLETTFEPLPWVFDVLVASKDGVAPQGLEHLPSTWPLTISQTAGWAVASNELLDGAQHDVLFLDDDIELLDETFDLLGLYWGRAEVFGFTLYLPDHVTQQSAGWVFEIPGGLRRLSVPVPSYVPIVTASCMVVKRAVLEAGVRFPVWPGSHLEDVAFMLDCWLHGFRVCCLTGRALHHMSDMAGIGRTKAQQPDLGGLLQQNRQRLEEWVVAHDVAGALADGLIPSGTVWLCP
jgi:hypothetical protein